MKSGLKMTNEKKENGRVIKYLLFPSLVISFILLFIYPPDRLAFGLYLAMGLWSLNAYMNKNYKEEVYGIKNRIFTKYIWGLAIGGAFLVASAVVPTFSLLVPSFSLSVSTDVRTFIIIALAPLCEEIFRSSTIGYIKEIYKTKKFWIVNIFQALIFASLHTLVYGLVMNSYLSWFEVFGTFYAIAGSLLAAFVFGLVSGYMMEKFDDVVPSIAAHQIINFWIIREGILVVALGLIVIKKLKKHNEKIKI